MPDYTLTTSPKMARRHAKETRFKWYGRGAIIISIAFLVMMFTAIIYRGAGAFQQTQIALNVEFTETVIDPSGTRDSANIKQANYKPLYGFRVHQKLTFSLKERLTLNSQKIYAASKTKR